MISRLFARQTNESGQNEGMSGQTISIIAIVIVVVLISSLVASYVVLRNLRSRNKSPKLLPSKWLKKRWEQWQPQSKYKSVNSAERGESINTSESTAYRGHEEQAATQAAAAGVDRNTSVRSVMTLPAYSQAPKETEQVIAREGERGGMDTVVEFPETAEEEEAVREQEMESLYQIRLARRREIAEREERRRERREARQRGDTQRLEELRRESRQRAASGASASSGNLTADTLIAEHNSRPKDRRVSSVAYGALGQVRHDGTRLRANSAESERGGLLDGAAPMGEHGRSGSDATSLFTINNLSRPSIQNGRQRSDSGAASVSTNASSFDLPQPTPTTTNEEANRPSDEGSNPRTTNTSPSEAQFTPEGTSHGSDDNMDTRIVSVTRDSENDIMNPPDYDMHDWGDAPNYEEAIRRRESQRIERERLSQRNSVISRPSPISPVAPQLDVPRISVQLASEPSSPALPRVSEDHGDRDGPDTSR